VAPPVPQVKKVVFLVTKITITLYINFEVSPLILLYMMCFFFLHLTICFNYRYEYQWCDTDSVKYKRPTALPAPKYISLLMDWVESQINDENIFPIKVGE
jgi:hypothetical protein